MQRRANEANLALIADTYFEINDPRTVRFCHDCVKLCEVEKMEMICYLLGKNISVWKAI